MCLVEIDGVRGLPPACTTPVDGGHGRPHHVAGREEGAGRRARVPAHQPSARLSRCATAAASVPCRTRRSRSVPARAASSRRSGTSRSPSRSATWWRSTASGASSAPAAPASPDEVAGDPLISFNERGNETQVLTFPDDPFTSYFSGNTVQICPVGALTADALPLPRPTLGPRAGGVDLHDVRGRLPHRRAVVVQPPRALPRRRRRADQPRLALRQGPVRLRGDQLRRRGCARRSSRAGGRVRRAGRDVVGRGARRGGATACARARELHGPGAIAVLGGARLANEDAYAWAKLAKGVLGTDSVDCQLGDGLPAERRARAAPRHHRRRVPRRRSSSSSPAISRRSCPSSTCACARRSVDGGAVADRARAAGHGAHPSRAVRPSSTGRARPPHSPRRWWAGTATSRWAAGVADGRHRRGAPAARGPRRRRRRAGPPVARRIGGSPSPRPPAVLAAGAAERALPARAAARQRARRARHGPGARHPARSGGARRRARVVRRRVGLGCPRSTGLDAARDPARRPPTGGIHALVLLGADPLADFPDRALARRALAGAGFVIAVDLFATDSVKQADVVFPRPASPSGRARPPTSRVASAGWARRSHRRAPRAPTG